MNRVKPADTAFVHRDALWLAQYYTSWTAPGSRSGAANQRNWINSYYSSVHPHASGQAYQNYPDPSLPNLAAGLLRRELPPAADDQERV